jgi:hypothetical protein
VLGAGWVVGGAWLAGRLHALAGPDAVPHTKPVAITGMYSWPAKVRATDKGEVATLGRREPCDGLAERGRQAGQVGDAAVLGANPSHDVVVIEVRGDVVARPRGSCPRRPGR